MGQTPFVHFKRCVASQSARLGDSLRGLFSRPTQEGCRQSFIDRLSSEEGLGDLSLSKTRLDPLTQRAAYFPLTPLPRSSGLYYLRISSSLIMEEKTWSPNASHECLILAPMIAEYSITFPFRALTPSFLRQIHQDHLPQGFRTRMA